MKRGRQPNIADEDMLIINGRTAGSRLKVNSDRKALIEHIVSLGGRCLLSEINEAMGFDTREIINALVAAGWLEVIAEGAEDRPPMPTRWPREQTA